MYYTWSDFRERDFGKLRRFGFVLRIKSFLAQIFTTALKNKNFSAHESTLATKFVILPIHKMSIRKISLPFCLAKVGLDKLSPSKVEPIGKGVIPEP